MTLHRLVAWLTLPRLAFAILFLALLVTRDLWDPDYFWHLATGQYIVTHGEIPRADIFSFTHPGKPWVAHEWLFQAMLYLIHEGFGDWGVKLMTALLPMTALYFVYRAARIVQPTGWMPVIGLMVIMILLTSFSTPRPQLVSFVLFAFHLFLLFRVKYAKADTRILGWFVPFMALWVNMHGGYVAGFALVGLFAATEAIQAWYRGWTAEDGRGLRVLAWVLVGMLLASALNPDHVRHWLYPFEVMGMEASRSMISEWASPDFHYLSGQLFLLLVFGYFALSAWRVSRPDLTELAMPMFFILMSLVAVRHQQLALLALLPFMARAWSQLPFETLRIRFARLEARWAARKGREMGGQLEGVLNLILLGVVLLIVVAYAPVREASFTERRDELAPFGAVEFIQQHGLRGRIFGTYHYGGYLIHALYPEQKVFIDGRADMYGDAFLKEHGDIYSGKVGWDKAFDHWQIDMVMTELNAPIHQLLLVRGDFVPVYADQHNGLLVRRELAKEKNLPILP